MEMEMKMETLIRRNHTSFLRAIVFTWEEAGKLSFDRVPSTRLGPLQQLTQQLYTFELENLENMSSW